MNKMKTSCYYCIYLFVCRYCVVRDNSIKYEKVVDCTLKQLTALPFAVSITCLSCDYNFDT